MFQATSCWLSGAAFLLMAQCAMPHKTLFVLLPPTLVDVEHPMSCLLTFNVFCRLAWLALEQV